jgi:hypothetical protein
LFRRNTVVVSVPYHIDGSKAEVLGEVPGASTGD